MLPRLISFIHFDVPKEVGVLGQLRFLRYVSIRTQALSMKAGRPMAELNIVASIFDCVDETGTAKITWRRSEFSPSLI